MSVGPSVNRSPVGLLFQRFLGAVTRRPETSEVEAAFRARQADGTEPSSALLLTTLNRMVGRQFALDGQCPSPADHYGQGLGTIPDGRGYTALGGMGGAPGVAATPVGQSIQAAMDQDPAFKEKLEAALGGQLLNTGTSDGRLLVLQAQQGSPSPTLSALSTGNQPSIQVQPMTVMHAASQAAGVPGAPSNMGPIFAGLQQMEANVKKLVMELGDKGTVDPNAQQEGTDFQTMSQGILGMASQMQLGGGDDDEEGGMGSMPIGAGMMGQMAGNPGSNGRNPAAQNVVGALQPQGLSDTMKQQMLQQMMANLSKMYTLLSNILKQMNEMQKTAIDNVK